MAAQHRTITILIVRPMIDNIDYRALALVGHWPARPGRADFLNVVQKVPRDRVQARARGAAAETAVCYPCPARVGV